LLKEQAERLERVKQISTEAEQIKKEVESLKKGE
jgi:hypothetical protein